jgi:hypothetical protein
LILGLNGPVCEGINFLHTAAHVLSDDFIDPSIDHGSRRSVVYVLLSHY